MVLEYCPGQDLFYWLDERQDSSMALYGDFHSRATSPFQGYIAPSPVRPKPMELATNCTEEEEFLSKTITQVSTGADLMSSHASSRRNLSGESDRTPPSPSLLSATENSNLLSRKRLRLISRMFGQMCSAIEICHQDGVAHRDIKPENFIVMDGRGEGGLDGERGRGRGRVVVKITDWGLGTREDMCEDFDCGSKPYMAYGEIFRFPNPYFDTDLISLECRNNLEPTYNPRQADVWSLGLVLLNLLYHRNPWADPSLNDPDFAAYVAAPIEFLQDRFEGIGLEVATFLTNRVFCDILEIDEETGEMRRRVTAGEFGIWSEDLVGMMGEGNRKRASVSEHTFQLTSDIIRPLPINKSPQNVSLLTQYAPIVTSSPVNINLFEENGNETLQPNLFLSTETPTRSSYGRSYSNEDDSLPSPSFPPSKLDSSYCTDSIPVSPLRIFASERATPSRSPLGTPMELPPSVSSAPAIAIAIPPRRSSLESSTLEESIRNGSPGLTSGFSEIAIAESMESGSLESEAAVAKARRRKRGARKGKAARAADSAELNTSNPTSPISPQSSGIDSNRDRILTDLATASQDLAREVSKATRTFGTRSASALPSTSTQKPIITSPIKKNGVFDRMKNLVSDGNPDLQAFKLRAQERNGRDDIISAPAKLQGNSRNRSNGADSWGSFDEDRGRDNHDHWGSSTSRRERLEARKKEFSPTSSSREVDSRITSVVNGEGGSGHDWRAPTMNRNSGSTATVTDKSRFLPPPISVTATTPPSHHSTAHHVPSNHSVTSNLYSPTRKFSDSKSSIPSPTTLVNGSPASIIYAAKDGLSSKNGGNERGNRNKLNRIWQKLNLQ